MNNVTPETIETFGKQNGVFSYSGAKLAFKKHHDDYDLTLNSGDKFVVKGLKVWQEDSPKIKFTLTMSEKILLICRSSSTLIVKPKKIHKPTAAETAANDRAVSRMNADNVMASFVKTFRAPRAASKKPSKAVTFNGTQKAMCHILMGHYGNGKVCMSTRRGDPLKYFKDEKDNLIGEYTTATKSGWYLPTATGANIEVDVAKKFGGYTMKKVKTFKTRHGIAYSAAVYKDGTLLGNVEHMPERFDASFTFNTTQLDKDAKKLKFKDATQLCEHLSFTYA